SPTLFDKCCGFFNVRGVWLSPNTGPPFNVLSEARPEPKLGTHLHLSEGHKVGGIGQDSNPRPLESGPKTLPLLHTTSQVQSVKKSISWLGDENLRGNLQKTFRAIAADSCRCEPIGGTSDDWAFVLITSVLRPVELSFYTNSADVTKGGGTIPKDRVTWGPYLHIVTVFLLSMCVWVGGVQSNCLMTFVIATLRVIMAPTVIGLAAVEANLTLSTRRRTTFMDQVQMNDILLQLRDASNELPRSESSKRQSAVWMQRVWLVTTRCSKSACNTARAVSGDVSSGNDYRILYVRNSAVSRLRRAMTKGEKLGCFPAAQLLRKRLANGYSSAIFHHLQHNQGHSFKLESTDVLDPETRWWERGVKEAIYECTTPPSTGKGGYTVVPLLC
ncbi:hypothetical protein Bbelb_096180, partial [Branchiostoma belcheri]